MHLPPPYDLGTEAEILEHLGTSRTSLHRYMRREFDPAPVAKHLGRLIASKAELEAWSARQVVRLDTRAANNAPLPSESA